MLNMIFYSNNFWQKNLHFARIRKIGIKSDINVIIEFRNKTR